MPNKWIDTILKFKAKYPDLKLVEIVKKAKQYYIKKSEVRKLERELNIKIDYL